MVLTSLPRMAEAARTVTPNERGLFYGLPDQCPGNFNCTDWSGIGAYVGQFSYQNMFNNMDSSILKLGHGRLQHFADFDDWTEALFPYAQFAQYDASEVAAGRPSMFASATYQNRKRPVLWNWYGITAAPYGGSPGRPVNLKDERFIQFWVNQYVRPWMQKINKPNTVVLLDNCTFTYGAYGVKDDYGNFITGVTWDQPYAQNQTEFLNSINNFFIRVRQIDPSIKMVCNTDASATPNEFVNSFQNLDGITIESMEYYYQGSDSWWRSTFYNQYQNAAWIGNTGKIGLMIWQVPYNDTRALRRDYMHYLMVRGDNFFFAPQYGHTEVPPSLYAGMKSALGTPTGATVITPEAGRTQGFNLYSRQTSGGIAYLNWSGVTKTVSLPAGRQYVNSSGQSVTQITIGDMDGDYVLFSGSASSNQPPTVTLTTPTNGANYTVPATITMTANASDPDGSIVRVEFYQGANKLGEKYAAPYTWTILNPPAGNYSGAYALTVKAVDNSGAVTTSNAVAVSVGATGNQSPLVSLTAPFNGASYSAPATIVMNVTASDPDGSIARVEFYQGANKLGEKYAAPYTWTIYNAPAGDYSGGYALTARAFDNSGASTTSNAVAVSVSAGGNQPPVVSLTAPGNGAVYTAPTNIVMAASALDPDGSIVRVEFYQGANKLGERYAAPYTWTIYNPPAGVYSGIYALTVKAVDNSGAVTTSNAVAVTVR